MVCRDLMATIIALSIRSGAGLLTFLWYIGIQLEITCPSLIAGIALCVVLELHGTVLLAIQPDGKALVI